MEWQILKETDGVVEIQASSWEGFVTCIQNELSKYRAYIFRGQREPEWMLKPSLERIDDPVKTLRFDSLQGFQIASRGRRGLNPRSLEEDEWWALGQHHGLKTPLLDWTESPFVAAFFAFLTERESKVLPKYRVVYALAKQQIIKKTEEIKKIPLPSFLSQHPLIDIILPQVDDNMRLISQRGLFTKSTYNLDIEDWVRKNFKGATSWIMIKILINESQGDREHFLRFLNHMNINYLSLFPDLEGAAKYTNMRLEIRDY